MESQTVKKIIKIINKSIIGLFTIIETILANKTKERYKISTKSKPSIKESDRAIPNQLLKKIKIEKYKIVTKFSVI
jgi:hypothetical protein